MIRETKSTLDEAKRRPSENAKIKAAKKHFAAIGVGDYAVSVPGSWKLDREDIPDYGPGSVKPLIYDRR
jgi:restriction endonuclease